MRTIIILFFLPFTFGLQAQSNPLIVEQAQSVCSCLHKEVKNKSDLQHFLDCTHKYAQTKDLLWELMLYCEFYRYFFEVYLHEKILPYKVRAAQKMLEGDNFDPKAKHSVARLFKYLKIYTSAYHMDQAYYIADKILKAQPNHAKAHFYKAYILLYWEDFVSAEVQFKKFQKLSGEYVLSYQMLAYTQAKSVDYEDEND